MKKVVTTPPVEIAIRTLDSDGARRVYAWFDRLKNWDNDAQVREISHRLPDLSGIYVLRTSTDIRIFFRIDGDVITVLDVAKKPAILTSGHVGGIS
jgi:hypothetical protein